MSRPHMILCPPCRDLPLEATGVQGSNFSFLAPPVVLPDVADMLSRAAMSRISDLPHEGVLPVPMLSRAAFS